MNDLTPQFPEALTWPQRARAIKIVDAACYKQAAEMKLDLASLRKRIVEEFAPMKEAAHKAHKAITSKEKQYLDPLVEAEGVIASELKRYTAEQDRIRRAEEERLRREAREREEADRLAMAVAAEAEGASPEEVVQILETPQYVAPVVAAPTFEPIKGLGLRTTWGAKVVDLKALARAVVAGEVPETYIEPNMVALNARARSDKQLLRIPGVVAEER